MSDLNDLTNSVLGHLGGLSSAIGLGGLGNQALQQQAASPSETVLQEAARLVDKEREMSYGAPAKNFRQIAELWSTILGCKINERQVGHCLIALKISRDMNSASRDNLVDIAGYARVLERVDAALATQNYNNLLKSSQDAIR